MAKMKAQDLADVIEALVQADEIRVVMIGSRKLCIAKEE